MDTFISKLPEGAGASAPASARSASPSPAHGTDTPAAKAAASAVAEPRREPTREEQLRRANEHLARLDSRLQFRLDDASGRMVVAVVNRETSEVLRQIPSEEMLAIALRLETHLQELNARTGLLLVDEA